LGARAGIERNITEIPPEPTPVQPQQLATTDSAGLRALNELFGDVFDGAEA
jgi:hypothetical protein